ncbi:MAG: hypothetical protein RRC34_13825 [Lentisphaeria bacterium]|nr:hypothetical protein [Lentisphaeria bacterium]
MSGVLADIKKEVGKYSPEGKGSCNCILKLNLSAHSGVPGMIRLGDGSIIPGTRQMIQQAQKTLSEHPDDPRALSTLNYNIREQNFLKEIKKLMCHEGGSIDFAQCKTGGSPETEAFLDDIFGDDVDTITHNNKNVVWVWGRVKEVRPKTPKEPSSETSKNAKKY